jgi:hypothetical protein
MAQTTKNPDNDSDVKEPPKAESKEPPKAEPKPVEKIDKIETTAQLMPIEQIGMEIIRICSASSESVVPLRQLVARVYPRTSKEDSMRFLAALTKMRQVAEVAYQVGNDVHGDIMNKP